MKKEAVIGFDVSAIVNEEKPFRVWVDFNEQIKVEINYIPREEFAGLIDKATTTTFDRRTHQKEEQLDNIKFGELLGKRAINNWSGLVVKEEVFPCTDDNKVLIMRKWIAFAKFIASICADLERLVAVEKEAARKN